MKKTEDKKNFNYYSSAAEQGDASGQYNLGELYYYGTEVSQNFETARYWFEEATKQDNAAAQCNLGLMYRDGVGGDKNLEKARYWIQKATEQGYAGAQTLLEQLVSVSK